ncbi:2-pyrone-4,6-dicarboxylate lactonase [Coniochaeta hoffmannii]|uniref:2-pyrone-4,6-dicarboxylate lactonase n=1 Tax=Coniochaeta hoffmannii TaxID=91930 RepID=A0AA38VU02_9PEZI|nr:2-pyrone-4,6-dicarboxylate lactonase [Coniochaeta hoffmannii]
MAPNSLVPANAWDTHIHVFDPDNFPYSPKRSYTPKPALITEYPFSTTGCKNIVVVQATVQGHSPNPLLADLGNKSTQATNIRGLCTIELSPETSDAELDTLHAAGVRGIRMSTMTWGHGTQAEAFEIAEKILAVAERVARLAWVVDVFTDVKTWAAMADLIRRELDMRVKLVADHCGGTYPGQEETEDFEKFLQLVREGFLFVKLSGFDRMYAGREGGMAAMEPIVKAIVEANPKRILYGSDWPHTQLGVSRKGKSDDQRLKDVEDFRDVDDEMHIRTLRGWIPDDETWQNLWVNNPKQVFE